MAAGPTSKAPSRPTKRLWLFVLVACPAEAGLIVVPYDGRYDLRGWRGRRYQRNVAFGVGTYYVESWGSSSSNIGASGATNTYVLVP